MGRSETAERVEKTNRGSQATAKTATGEERALALYVAHDAYARTPEYRGVKIVKQVFEHEDFDFLKLVAQRLVAQGPCVALLGNKGTQAQIVLAQTESSSWICVGCSTNAVR